MDPLLRASGLRGYPALMRDMGCDPVPLLRRYHITEAALERDDTLISLRSATHLLEASAEVTGCGDFGLRLSSYQSIDVLGPLSVVLRNAPTIRDALNDVMHYLFVHSPGIVVSVNERSRLVENTVAVSVELHLSGPVVTRQNSDLCLADAHNFLRLFAGDRYALQAVSIPHEPVVGRAVYERFFGARLLEEPVGATLYLARDTFAATCKARTHRFTRSRKTISSGISGPPKEGRRIASVRCCGKRSARRAPTRPASPPCLRCIRERCSVASARRGRASKFSGTTSASSSPCTIFATPG